MFVVPFILNTLQQSPRPLAVRDISAAFQRTARKALLQVKDIKLPTPTLGHVPKGDKRWRALQSQLAPNVQKTPTPAQPQGRAEGPAPSGGKGGGGSGGGSGDEEIDGRLDFFRYFGFPRKNHGSTQKYRSWLGRIVTETLVLE